MNLRIGKKALFRICLGLCSAGLSLLLLEVAYRIQLFDFYQTELRAFNPPGDLDRSNVATWLVFGDSFSAGNSSYVNVLREKLPETRIVNASIPGSGIIQTLLIARKRLTRFRPSLLLVQLYPGNDLFDIRHPINWRELSFRRNAYWLASNYLRSLSFLNYRLGQLRGGVAGEAYQPYRFGDYPFVSPDQFAPERFLNNEPIGLKADSQLIEKQVRLLADRKADFELMVNGLRLLLSQKDTDCRCVLLVIPHASQINRYYLERAKALGAVFEDEQAMLNNEGAFTTELRRRLPSCRIVDPLEPFRRAESTGIRLYWTNDIHLNPNGNELLADILSEVITHP
ncbi:MAG: hypothetical protein AB1898_03055 [Acidobacteriota bacterium]